MNAVSQLNREWVSIANGAVACALSRWQRDTPSLRRFASPAALLGFLKKATGSESDETLTALLELARHDQLAGRVVLQALLPALSEASQELAHPRARGRELVELLLFHAWEEICSPPVGAPPAAVAADLTLRVIAETTRDLRRIDVAPEPTKRQSSRPLPRCPASTLGQPGCERCGEPMRPPDLRPPAAAAAARVTADRSAA